MSSNNRKTLLKTIHDGIVTGQKRKGHMSMASFVIKKPENFNYDQCLTFLQRSEQELLHKIDGNIVYQAIIINEQRILFRIVEKKDYLQIDILQGEVTDDNQQFVHNYIQQMFDLKRDIKPFYEMAQQDHILGKLVQKYEGYRVIGIPDLFESIVWAIIGQQINLTFAYTLKKRLITKFGEKIVWTDKDLWVFPNYEQIAQLSVEDLRDLQFSKRKAEYIIDVAKLLQTGKLTKEKLEKLADHPLKKQLMAIRGIGEWTANYVMMRTFNRPRAFPVADVGLHRALEKQLDVEKRPTVAEIERLAKNWQGWEAYATFYLWRSLYE